MTEDIADASDARFPLLTLLRRHGAPDASALAVAVVLKVVATFVSFADVFLFGIAIDALFNGRPYAIPLVPAAWLPADQLGLLWFTGGLLVLLKLVDIGGTVLSQYGFGLFAYRTLDRVRVASFDRAMEAELGSYARLQVGDVMNVLNDDVNTLETFLEHFVGMFLWILVAVVGSFVYMALLNWQLAVFVLCLGPAIALVNGWFSRRIERRRDEARATAGALNSRLEAGVYGIETIKAFDAAAFERDRVEAASRDRYRAELDARRLSVRQRPVNRALLGAWLVVTLSVGIYWIRSGPPLVFSAALTAGQLVPFLFYMERITNPMRQLGLLIDGYKQSKAAARRIHGLTELDRRASTDATAELSVSDGRVTFEEVWFAYPGERDPALEDVSLTVEPGETVGVVGTSGAGKSTLLKLLLGFYEPDWGTVAVDGQDVGEVTPTSVRRAVGYVGQDAFVFDGTLWYNVAYGSPDATPLAVAQAVQQAGLEEVVESLPEGYETRIGDRGEDLSGGQEQRLAIARALAGDPPILVFDEATSQVDTETEAMLRERLADLTADRTTVVVAHRLSTVRDADRIVVLDDGRIVEEGTHEALIERDGRYAALWKIQAGAAEAVARDLDGAASTGVELE